MICATTRSQWIQELGDTTGHFDAAEPLHVTTRALSLGKLRGVDSA